MLKQLAAGVLAYSIMCATQGVDPVDQAALARDFAAPPGTARPWVYWTWIDGNINKAGITADLEAMKRMGIGGALILDVDQSTPRGTVKFFDPQWQELFKYTVLEAKRLGMEINMNDGPGYYGSGGPWVPPDKAMQTVVQSETHVRGGAPVSVLLPAPSRNQEYKDIAVVAVGETTRSAYRIPDLQMKALQWQAWVAYRGTQSAALDAAAPAGAAIPLEKVVDLTDKMAADGTLNWVAPVGEWTIIRFGHAWNGHLVGPSVRAETGPETDKMDKAATDLHFAAFVRHLNDVVGPEGRGALVATHIDSWEGGGQNWTPALRAEFKTRRGYDPIVYLPILTGRVLGDLQMTERFLFDLRLTVSELTIENYSAEFQRLAHAAGLRNTFESYTTIANDLDNAMYVDEPMAEFWTPNGQGLDFQPTIKSMSSAAHLNGYSVVGAESFTSGNQEKFKWTPAMIKSIGDTAFCGGINRFVFHRYAAQPFAEGVKPGMQMGPWSLHYERTNTWWEMSGAWHEYLARCQYLLRQGTFAADVLKLESEEPLHRFQDIKLTGYDYDACGPATFLRAGVRPAAEMRTADKLKVAFPNGAEYRLVILPDSPTMSVPLLTRIGELVRAGAAILGNPPQQTPGLTDYPKADADLKHMADDIWGTDPAVHDRPLGKGRVFRGITPEQALAALGDTPDFSTDADLKYIHRVVGDRDVYFLSHPANTTLTTTCTFRTATTGRPPELWDPQSGRITPLASYPTMDATHSRLSLTFEPSGSTFVVFRPASADPATRIMAISRDGKPYLENGVLTELPRAGESPAFDLVAGEIRQGGTYVITAGDLKSRTLTVAPPPDPVTVSGPWQL